MAKRRLKKKFKKKINITVRRVLSITMALVLVTVLISLESFSARAEETEDSSVDALTVLGSNASEDDVTWENDGAIEDGSDGAIEDGSDGAIEDGSDDAIEDGSDDAIEDESDDAIEDGSDDAIEDGSDDAIEDGSDDAIEDESDEAIEDESDEAIEDESDEAIEDESDEAIEDESDEKTEERAEEVSEENSEEKSDEASEDVSKDDKEKNKKDSKDEKKKTTIAYKAGDIVTFGRYEQDGNFDNGPEDIEWVVLSVDEEKVLVVSRYALDSRPYNTEYTDVTWETCSLRAWLNNDFLNAAFSGEEQEHIPEVTIANEDNSYYGTAGGNETTDRVFCLSLNEVKNLIGYSTFNDEYRYGYGQGLIVEPTQYAIDNGVATYEITEADYNAFLEGKYPADVMGRYGTWWWLRSPGDGNKFVCMVDCHGSAGEYFYNYVGTSNRAVRPALFINTLAEVNKPECIDADVELIEELKIIDKAKENDEEINEISEEIKEIDLEENEVIETRIPEDETFEAEPEVESEDNSEDEESKETTNEDVYNGLQGEDDTSEADRTDSAIRDEGIDEKDNEDVKDIFDEDKDSEFDFKSEDSADEAFNIVSEEVSE